MKESILLYQLLKSTGVKITGKAKKVESAVRYYMNQGNEEPVSVAQYYLALIAFAARNIKGTLPAAIVEPE